MNGDLKRIMNSAIYVSADILMVFAVKKENVRVENAKAPEDRPYQKRELNCTAYLCLSLASHD